MTSIENVDIPDTLVKQKELFDKYRRHERLTEFGISFPPLSILVVFAKCEFAK